MSDERDPTTPRGDFLGEPAADHEEPEPGPTTARTVERAPGVHPTPDGLPTGGYGKRAELPQPRPATGEG